MLSVAAAQQACEHWLLTFQLAPGIDVAHLAPEQKSVLMDHRKYVSTLYAKGLVVGGRTNNPIGTLAIAVLACDEATAKPRCPMTRRAAPATSRARCVRSIC